MIKATVKTKNNTKKVVKKLQDTTFKTLKHAAASLRLIASRSIRKSKNPSAPGSPPHSKTGRLSKSIWFEFDKQRMIAIIGPRAEYVGTSGAAHEFGGRYKKETFPKRPFMKPALEKIMPRLPQLWATSFSK